MRLLSVSLLALLTLTVGCALEDSHIPVADTDHIAMQGTLFGGQQPITGGTITAYAVGTSGYGAGATALASVTTDSSGNFTFPATGAGSITCPYSNTPVYLVGAGTTTSVPANVNLMMVAALGPCSSAKSASVNINEVTTVATVWALSHFINTTLGSGAAPLIGGTAAGSGVYNLGLVNAMQYMVPAMVSLAQGTANTGGTVGSLITTTEAAKINSAANALAACVNSTGQTSTTETSTNCGKLFSYTAPATGTRPSNTFQAAMQMALFPYKNVSSIYTLSASTPPFIGLSSAPNDWTIGMSYTSSAFGLAINGTATSRTSSNIDIDSKGRVWFPTNSGASHGLGVFDPALGTFAGPYATTLVHPQYVTVDRTDNPWADDLSANHFAGVLATSPTTVTPYATAAPTGPIRVSYGPSTSVDSLLFAEISSSGSGLFQEVSGTINNLNGSYLNPPTGIAVYPSPSYQEGDGAVSGSSSACVYQVAHTNGNASSNVVAATSAAPCFSGDNINMTALYDALITASELNQVCSYNAGACFAPPMPVSVPEGLALDGDGNVWLANSGNASVSTMLYTFKNSDATDYHATSPIAYLHDSTHGSTLTTPFGVAVDRSGNVWVSNASCITTSGTACTPGSFTLSVLVGAGAPSLTPLGVQTLRQVSGSYVGGGVRP